MIDLAFVRAQFPALSGDWVYLDNAGGSQTLRRVVDRVSDYLIHTNVQLGASYGVSQEAGARVNQAAARIAELVHARRPEEVVLGPSTTALVRGLAEAVGRTLRPGDEVIVSRCDHEANVGPWMRLAERGVVIKPWRVDPDALELRAEDLDRLLTDRTRLVAFTHASNVIGTIHPVAELTRLAHAAGARVCVDGVAFAPHGEVDVQALGADYYVFSLYKVYGPHQAVLVGEHEALRALPGLNHFFIGEDQVPYKLQPGGVSYELAWGSAGIVDYFEDLGRRADPALAGRGALQRAYEEIAAHEAVLQERLLSFLRDRRGVRIIGRRDGDRTRRVPTVSFVSAQRAPEEIVRAIDPHRIGIRHGDFYARRLAEDLGLATRGGVVRVSMVHYNTLEEIDRLILHLDAALG
ncbi:MAG: cysteine desulfurase-like protein [Polyangiaceae bacterium]|nr:cysteine desulfurase-like protein [Polyangiaceae bacterium]